MKSREQQNPPASQDPKLEVPAARGCARSVAGESLLFFINAACFLPCATSVAVLGPADWSRAVETGSGPAAFVFHVRGFNDHADRSLGVDWLLKKYTPTRFASLSRSLSQLSSPRVISPLEKEVAPPLSRRKKSTMSEREVPCALAHKMSMIMLQHGSQVSGWHR